MKYLKTYEGLKSWLENKIRSKKILLLDKIKSKIRDEYGLTQLDTGGKLILKNYRPPITIHKFDLEYNKILKPEYQWSLRMNFSYIDKEGWEHNQIDFF